MSDIQRYAVIETALCIGGKVLEGEVSMVRASEHDAELAALREELSDGLAVNKTLNTQCDGLQQRLTAAEQRNADLESENQRYKRARKFRHARLTKLLVQKAEAEERIEALDLEWSRTITDRGLITIELEKAKRLLDRSATAMSAIRNNPSLVRDIDDFLKPTESGASE